MEDPPPYHIGPTNSAEPPLTIEALIAQAHAQRQGIPYGTGEQLLQRLSERLRALCDCVLSSKANIGELAYGLASIIDALENAPTHTDRPLH